MSAESEKEFDDLVKYYSQFDKKDTPKADTGYAKYWEFENNFHRDDGRFDSDGSCVIITTFCLKWMKKGSFHRDVDQPAYMERNGYKAYWKNGCRHRLTGPAQIFSDGSVAYWIEGIQYSESEWKEKLKKKETSLEVDQFFLGCIQKRIKDSFVDYSNAFLTDLVKEELFKEGKEWSIDSIKNYSFDNFRSKIYNREQNLLEYRADFIELMEGYNVNVAGGWGNKEVNPCFGLTLNFKYIKREESEKEYCTWDSQIFLNHLLQQNIKRYIYEGKDHLNLSFDILKHLDNVGFEDYREQFRSDALNERDFLGTLENFVLQLKNSKKITKKVILHLQHPIQDLYPFKYSISFSRDRELEEWLKDKSLYQIENEIIVKLDDIMREVWNGKKESHLYFIDYDKEDSWQQGTVMICLNDLFEPKAVKTVEAILHKEKDEIYEKKKETSIITPLLIAAGLVALGTGSLSKKPKKKVKSGKNLPQEDKVIISCPKEDISHN